MSSTVTIKTQVVSQIQDVASGVAISQSKDFTDTASVNMELNFVTQTYALPLAGTPPINWTKISKGDIGPIREIFIVLLNPEQTSDTEFMALSVNTSLQFIRTTGSFVTDGFVAGDSIVISGFTTAGNNGTKTIDTVTALAITVTSTTGMVAETGGGNERIKCDKGIDILITDATDPNTPTPVAATFKMRGCFVATTNFASGQAVWVRSLGAATAELLTVVGGERSSV